MRDTLEQIDVAKRLFHEYEEVNYSTPFYIALLKKNDSWSFVEMYLALCLRLNQETSHL